MYAETIQIARKPTHIITFMVLMFGISWGVWVPMALASHSLINLPLSGMMLVLIGSFGPSLAAILLTAATEHLAGVRQLLGQLLIWRVGIRWYVFVLVWPAVLSLLTTAAHVVVSESSPDFAHPPVLDLYPIPPEVRDVGWWALLPLIFMQQVLVSSPMGEEIGWRGYALPRMQERSNALVASVVLGLIWSLWHLPLYFTSGHPLSNEVFVWLPFNLIPTTILFTWVFNHTRGSLLLALLFHGAINITDLFVAKTTTVPLISPALTWIVALTVIWAGGLRDTPRQSVQQS